MVHPTFRLPRWPVSSCAVLASLALGLGGCQTEARNFESTATPAALAPRESGPVPTGVPARLAARETFFAGAIEVDALVALRGAPGFGNERTGRSRERREGAGLGMPGYGERRRHGDDDDEGGDRDLGGFSAAPRSRLRTTEAQAKQLQLRLTNRGTAPVEVEVIDFDSVFGNFAVRPDRFTLAPGESAEAEPMVSRLEVNGETFLLTVRLRIGEQIEEHVLTLREVAEPPPPA